MGLLIGTANTISSDEVKESYPVPVPVPAPVVPVPVPVSPVPVPAPVVPVPVPVSPVPVPAPVVPVPVPVPVGSQQITIINNMSTLSVISGEVRPQGTASLVGDFPILPGTQSIFPHPVSTYNGYNIYYNASGNTIGTLYVNGVSQGPAYNTQNFYFVSYIGIVDTDTIVITLEDN